MISARFSRRLGVLGLAGLAVLAAAYWLTVEPAPRIRVLWRDGITAQQLVALEAKYFLRDGRDRLPEGSLAYDLLDTSRANIRRLVEDPAVADTNDIDRDAYIVEPDTDPGGEWTWIAYRVPGLREARSRQALILVLAIAAVVGLAREWLRLLRNIPTYARRVVHVWTTHGDLRGGGRAARLRVAILAAVSLACGAAFSWPVLGQLGGMTAFSDWDHFLTLHWVQYETVRQYGQVPLWNPYVCGGIPMLGNPQSRWLTPFFLLHLLSGPELALQLEIIAHLGIGWVGALLLGRVVGLSWLASVAPATVFTGCSYLYLHLAEGHVTWLVYAYMPGIMAAAASNRPVLAGVGLALAIGEGGVYPVPHTVLALAVLALHRGIAERSVRPFTNLGVTVLMAACVGAPKLLLMQPLLAQFPRIIQPTEAVSLELVARALLDPNQGLGTSVPGGHPYGFQEYGAYVGAIPLVLAVWGMFAAGRRTIPWVLLLGVGLALSLGGTLGGPYSPWALLHQLPILASLRIPSRLLLLTVLAVGMLAGFGIDRLMARRAGWRMAMAVVLLVAGTLDMARVGPSLLRHLGDSRSEPSERSATFVQVRGGNSKQMYAAARAHMGSLDCYEPLHPAVVAPVGVNEAGYRGEQYLLHGGTVRLVEWSPNRLTFAVSSDGPNALVVNYNYDAFWQAVSGTGRTFNHQGLLGVSIPAGSQELVLAYRTPRLTAGLLLAIAALTVAARTTLKRRPGVT